MQRLVGSDLALHLRINFANLDRVVAKVDDFGNVTYRSHRTPAAVFDDSGDLVTSFSDNAAWDVTRDALPVEEDILKYWAEPIPINEGGVWVP